jgi:hypothetical protein
MVVLVAGCTQTAQVLDPATAACYARCTPNGGCVVGFNVEEEIKTDKSVLVGTVDDLTVQEAAE